MNFTINTTSIPTQAQITAKITAYYKKCYAAIYGIGTYSSDDSTDKFNIIGSDEFKQELADLISHKMQKWHDSGINSQGDITTMPAFDLYYDSDVVEVKMQFVNFLKEASTINSSTEYVDNCRMWGSDYSDQSGVYF